MLELAALLETSKLQKFKGAGGTKLGKIGAPFALPPSLFSNRKGGKGFRAEVG